MASNTDINVVNRMMDNNKDREDPFQRDAMVMYFLRFSNIEMRLRVFRKPTLRWIQSTRNNHKVFVAAMLPQIEYQVSVHIVNDLIITKQF